MMVNLRSFALAGWLAMLGSGCNSSGGPSTPPGPKIESFPVNGEVTVKGKPADMARVFFRPLSPISTVEPNRVFDALTDAQGKFQCTTNVPGDGLPAGKYVVTVTWPEAVTDDAEYETDKLGGRYRDPRRSSIRVEVKPQPNQLPKFELQ